MLIRMSDLRWILHEAVLNGKNERENVLKPALIKLYKLLISNEELLSTQRGIDALNGLFMGLRPGDVPTIEHVNAEMSSFERLASRICGKDDVEKMGLARKWAESIDTYTIPALNAAATHSQKRPKSAPVEGHTWGKYLFSPARDDVPFERDTGDERSAYEAIHAMLFKNKPIPEKIAFQMQELVRNGEYLNLLYPGGHTTFYRGMNSVTDSFVKSLLGHAPASSGGDEKVDNVFVPVGTGSSWSVYEKSAFAYTVSQKSKKGTWSVILEAQHSQNESTFILNPETLYAIGDFAGSEDQDNESSEEVYAVGPVNISRVKYWR